MTEAIETRKAEFNPETSRYDAYAMFFNNWEWIGHADTKENAVMLLKEWEGSL